MPAAARGAALLVTRRASADPPRTRRLAVIVGANEPAPGRQALRYAQSDAQLMGDVLVRVGRRRCSSPTPPKSSPPSTAQRRS